MSTREKAISCTSDILPGITMTPRPKTPHAWPVTCATVSCIRNSLLRCPDVDEDHRKSGCFAMSHDSLPTVHLERLGWRGHCVGEGRGQELSTCLRQLCRCESMPSVQAHGNRAARLRLHDTAPMSPPGGLRPATPLRYLGTRSTVSSRTAWSVFLSPAAPGA